VGSLGDALGDLQIEKDWKLAGEKDGKYGTTELMSKLDSADFVF
jgi:hypothetical protein